MCSKDIDAEMFDINLSQSTIIYFYVCVYGHWFYSLNLYVVYSLIWYRILCYFKSWATLILFDVIYNKNKISDINH